MLSREWHENARRAFDASFTHPHDVKRRVQFLMDEGFWDQTRLTWEAAMTRYGASCDPAKNQFFKVSEVWALMKAFGCHDLALAMARDLGYEVKPAEPPDNAEAIIRRLAALHDEQTNLLERLQSMLLGQQRIPPPGVDAPRRFALDAPQESDPPADGKAGF